MGCRGRDPMVCIFTTIYAISAYRTATCEMQTGYKNKQVLILINEKQKDCFQKNNNREI
jgi:hypothetical protein